MAPCPGATQKNPTISRSFNCLFLFPVEFFQFRFISVNVYVVCVYVVYMYLCGVCVCLCLRVDMFVGCVCEKRAEVDIRCLQSLLLSMELTDWTRLISQQALGILCLSFGVLAFYAFPRDLNSGSHACTPSALPISPALLWSCYQPNCVRKFLSGSSQNHVLPQPTLNCGVSLPAQVISLPTG